VVEGNGAGSEEYEREGEGGQSKGEFIPAVAHQAFVEMDFGDGDGHIDTNGKSGHPGEQTHNYEQAAKEFGKGGKIRSPAWQSEAGDKLDMVVKSAENLLVSVANHDGAQGQAHDEKREGLQTIEKAQRVPPAKRRKERLQQWDG
jgi:hypothetical protein